MKNNQTPPRWAIDLDIKLNAIIDHFGIDVMQYYEFEDAKENLTTEQFGNSELLPTCKQFLQVGEDDHSGRSEKFDLSKWDKEISKIKEKENNGNATTPDEALRQRQEARRNEGKEEMSNWLEEKKGNVPSFCFEVEQKKINRRYSDKMRDFCVQNFALLPFQCHNFNVSFKEGAYYVEITDEAVKALTRNERSILKKYIDELFKGIEFQYVKNEQ